MKRTPLKRKTSLKAKGRIIRRSRLERRGRKHRRRHEETFGEKASFVRAQRCDTCGAQPLNDPSHYPSRGAGGMSRDLFPQCTACHRQMHDGIETFLVVIGKSKPWLRKRTAYWEQRWQESRNGA